MKITVVYTNIFAVTEKL